MKGRFCVFRFLPAVVHWTEEAACHRAHVRRQPGEFVSTHFWRFLPSFQDADICRSRPAVRASTPRTSNYFAISILLSRYTTIARCNFRTLTCSNWSLALPQKVWWCVIDLYLLVPRHGNSMCLLLKKTVMTCLINTMNLTYSQISFESLILLDKKRDF